MTAPSRAAPTPAGGVTTATAAGLIACPHCRLVCRDTSRHRARCPRCAAPLHPRKVDSLSRTWALLIAAAILYIPANALPVMHTASLFANEDDTILSGIIYFWTSGSPGLAALIFTVSILIPLAKLSALAVLSLSIQRRARSGPQARARLFHLIEVVGRWSMLDVFVVALMVGLVHFRGLATIEAGPGAAAFGAVVVLTMQASHSFDPRMIWDQAHPTVPPAAPGEGHPSADAPPLIETPPHG